MSEPFVIRPAMAADLDDMGRLGATLVSTHHRFDPRRFMAPRPQADVGYARFLGSQLTEPDTLLLVADCAGRVAGYVYATLEPTSWVELRDACGYVHDVVVDAPMRRAGVARALMEAACAWMTARGAPRVVLLSAEQNVEAQRLFEQLGFRRTMVEFTREL
jgi:ribosomal protein S18 acetylase RimI-like enzyme